MPSIVTYKFRQYNADQFREAFSEASRDYLYLFIGRVRPWGDETAPPTPTDAVANTEFDFWRDMISAKLIANTDVAYCVPRYDWTTGTAYTQYTHDNGNLYANNFFVMTDQYNVYKCLYNNGGVASTVKPTGTSTSQFTTADGYVWKFLYTITAAEALKWVTDDYIPVKTLTANDGSPQWSVQQAATNGSIDIIELTNAGNQFDNYDSGTFASVTNSSVMVLAGSASTTDDVYTNSTLYISAGTGSGQHRKIIDYTGSTRTVTLESGFDTTPTTGSSYRVAPTVTVAGDGSGARAISVMNTTSNTIHTLSVTNAGSGYTRSTVTISANGLSGATGTAYISPPGGHGSDPVGELGGFNLILNSRLDKTESGVFTISNDFRKIGIVANPVLTSNGSAATDTRYDQTLRLGISSVSGTFQADELVTGGSTGATAYVVEANTTALKLTFESSTSFANLEGLTGGTSGATANVNGITLPSLRKNTGDLLYSEFREPITRSSDQIEDIKLIIKF